MRAQEKYCLNFILVPAPVIVLRFILPRFIIRHDIDVIAYNSQYTQIKASLYVHY